MKKAKSSITADGRPHNIYLSASLVEKARTHAKDVYGMSLSSMLTRLIAAELESKRGLFRFRAKVG